MNMNLILEQETGWNWSRRGIYAGILQEGSSGRGNNGNVRVSAPRQLLSDTLTSVSEITTRQHFCCRSHIGNIGLKFF